jgi:putative transposase
LPNGKLKNIILLRKPSGWYVCLQVELPEPEPEQHIGPAVGIDMGITHALALSNGVVFDSPKHPQQSLAKLRRLQRRVTRRTKGSHRWHKAAHQLAKQQEHIANQRRDWWHKVTCKLVDTYGTIVLENLNLNFMLQNGNLARAAHDVSLGIFRELLDYKAIEVGVAIITVDRAYTSQACSSCGSIVQKSLSIRIHHCPDCGLILDRDINAARNILSAGTRRSDANVDGCIMRSPRSSTPYRGELSPETNSSKHGERIKLITSGAG